MILYCVSIGVLAIVGVYFIRKYSVLDEYIVSDEEEEEE